MSYSELFVSHCGTFGGIQKPFEKADYIILGVPFDNTSTFRTGARFGPDAIRTASLNMETFSVRTGNDFEKLPLHDLGNLHISLDVNETLKRIQLVVQEILDVGKKPVTIGGEHTITLGILRAIAKNDVKPALVVFDAHLDLRNKLMGVHVSHATFIRRILEEGKLAKVIEVGTRGLCAEELNFANTKAEIEFFTVNKVRSEGVEQISRLIKKELTGCDTVYISIDMDVLDPAYVPAVQNPEPEGLEPHTLLDILRGICDKHVVGFDVVEITPHFDYGISAIHAAKIISEMLSYLDNLKV
jgi:agmatinase